PKVDIKCQTSNCKHCPQYSCSIKYDIKGYMDGINNLYLCTIRWYTI
uniref:Uncharacterized protein n=1 Tax=Amphimedon queenslandica TaxID=400682 RepID=A0A1X7VFT6_AMPQE